MYLRDGVFSCVLFRNRYLCIFLRLDTENSNVRAISEKLDTVLYSIRRLEIGQDILAAKGNNVDSKTPASKGAYLKKTLGHLYIENQSILNEAAFLKKDEQKSAVNSVLGVDGKKLHERYLVAWFMGKFQEKLMSVFPPYCVLVNSEEYSWMPQASGLKRHLIAPDLFVAAHYLVNFRAPYTNAPPAGNSAHYGEFRDFGARRGLAAILDGKQKLDDKAIGEFADYLIISSKSDNQGALEIRGMVFDEEKYCLMAANQQKIMKMIDGYWLNEGSLNIIRDFFDNWMFDRTTHDALSSICSKLELNLLEYSSTSLGENQMAYSLLGTGGSGRVFSVLQDGKALCLKVVVGSDNCKALKREFEFTSHYAECCPGEVVGVMPDSFVELEGCAGYLMEFVGIPFCYREEVLCNDIKCILRNLANMHSAKVLHGDTRFRNIVKCGNAYRWIDFSNSVPISSGGIKDDIKIFLESVNTAYDDTRLSYYAKKCYEGKFSSVEERHSCVLEILEASSGNR